MTTARFKMSPGQEVDGGMFVVLTDDSGTTLAKIYHAPKTNPPEGWEAGQIYYQILVAWPTSGSISFTAIANARPPTSTTGYKAATPQSFVEGTPSSSGRLFMYTDSSRVVTWGIDLSGITGTGSDASGKAVWWNDDDGDIALPASGTLSDDTAGTTASYYTATDSLG